MGTWVISDIHIGNNSPTCWYQKSINEKSFHEGYLLALLDWIIHNVTQKNPPIDRLIILGDLFDFWTYPPDQRPPTIQDILDANPKLFGSDGMMRKVIDALNGNVLYIRGNHDINITQSDLDLIATNKNGIKLVDDIYYDSDGIVYTHGHLFTMFNAPDPRFPGEVPVGHFVTRAIAYHVSRTLQAGETAANLPDQGSPYGPDLSSIIPGLSGQFSNPSIIGVLLDYMAAWAGLDEHFPILMADGTSTCIAEVKTKYDYLWTDWVARNGGGDFGEMVATKAAQADYDGSYMSWFAQKIAMQYGALGTVMGHTHKPKLGIQNSMIRYLNCGFECPSIPDIDSKKNCFNFSTVDSQSNLHLWKVVKKGEEDYEVKPADTDVDSDQVVFGPLEDFSCYVRISNNTDKELILQTQDARYGYYVVPPPNRIPAFTTVDIWLQDCFGFHGAEGSVTYSHPDGGESLIFTYDCPTGCFSNRASGGAEFVATSGNPPSGILTHKQVPEDGHPLFVHFFVASGVSDLPVTDTSLKSFLIGIGTNPAAGIRHFAPDTPNFSVRDFIRSSSYL